MECISIKFSVKFDKTPTEIYEMQQTAYRDKAISGLQTFQWFKHFQEGRQDVKNDPRSGRPKMTTNPKFGERCINYLQETTN
jgi:hypothetical protein